MMWVRVLEPALEDVFVSVLGAKEEDNAHE